MKIKASSVVLVIMTLYVIWSPAQIALLLESFGLKNFIRYFRLFTIPAFIFLALDLLPKLTKFQIRRLLVFSIPVGFLSLLNIYQLVGLPDDVISEHVTGSVKFTSTFFLYQCILLSLRLETANRFRKALSVLLLLTFVGIVGQYPHLIIQSGVSVGSIVSNFGQTDKRLQTAGLFGGANGDANASASLFPIILFYIEKTSGLKKQILRIFIFIYYPLVLLYNGTRTALVIIFPLTLILFYSNLSFKRLSRQLLLLPFIAPILYIFQSLFLSRAFSSESGSEGTFGWRVSQVWTPAINFTSNNSPFLGFGSRGWEYIVDKLLLFAPEGHMFTPHNTYVWSYVTWGIIGSFLYMSFIAILLVKSYQSSKSNNIEISKLGKAAFCSTISYCLWSAISNSHLDQGWMVFFTLASLIASLQVSRPINIDIVHDKKQSNQYP